MKLDLICFTTAAGAKVEVRDVEVAANTPQAWEALGKFLTHFSINGVPPGPILEVPMAYGKYP